ncbi:MAG: valine--tRNA ligase [Verrucomicrobia bacterium]|nr:valine--tRNA ligase [Verrucomicrobiota bacterium]
MSLSELSKAYTPTDVEPLWYQRWIDAGCFHADEKSSAPAFSIVMPPPNVTGVLTLGHVLNNTLQDILARRARQTGHEVLWLPGTDHAGIATQTVVERQLRKEEKKTRHDLGRTAFLEKVWEWKKKHGGIILEQLQRLGCSCDWKRERFTMDEAYSKKVQETFIDLHQKGMIYRGKRMVNWCPVSRTALSDEEVIPKKQKGILYHYKLEIIEQPGTWLEIATTRPETIMADVALAVNPNDPRYAPLIGKHVHRPLGPLAEIPVIGDEAVEMTFGTGILKVTPAHDKVDYEIGLRHQLPIIDVMNPDGTLNEFAGEEFAGLDRFEARMKAGERLRELGLLVKEEPYENNVGFSERADVPIEPRLSEQWFLRYPKTKEARAAVQQHLVRFFPDRWEKVYDHWLEHIQDWCISRQLWWGHQIPAWHSADRSEIKVQLESPGEGWIQDPDVLDTWFSSWLWAHETMDEVTRKKFYPTSVLVTGPDIIFFWVARMIMAGLEYTYALPFRDVYFTGIIRDKQGRKMSKSLGNSPNPLDLIATYGADGLRFGMMRIAPTGQDIRFDEQQIVEGRNFANKVWNAARFREMQGTCSPHPNLAEHELPDIAITLLSQFETMHGALKKAYAEYRFQEIAGLLYDFFWGDYCDWFIEAAKPTLAASQQFKLQVEVEESEKQKERFALLSTMDVVLAGFLHLLHPLMPHITEELWERLGFKEKSGFAERADFLLYAQPPQEKLLAHLSPEKIESAKNSTLALYSAIHAARNLRSECKINAKQAVDFLITPKDEITSWSPDQLEIFSALARGKNVTISHEAPPKESASVITDLGTITIPLAGLIDPVAEKNRLTIEIKNVEAELLKVRTKLNNPAFVEKVPAAILQEHREREVRWQERLESLQAMLGKLYSVLN